MTITHYVCFGACFSVYKYSRGTHLTHQGNLHLWLGTTTVLAGFSVLFCWPTPSSGKENVMKIIQRSKKILGTTGRSEYIIYVYGVRNAKNV